MRRWAWTPGAAASTATSPSPTSSAARPTFRKTGGRACGLVQAALEATARYVAERRQFGQPIGAWGLTRYHVGRMAHRLIAARAITYAAAAAMDRDERTSAPLAAMAKLFACDVAVEVTQLGQRSGSPTRRWAW